MLPVKPLFAAPVPFAIPAARSTSDEREVKIKIKFANEP
jgi:hypothetical protein